MGGAFCRWFLAFSLLILCAGCGSASGETRIREATHADGQWYPSTASELSEMVDRDTAAR